MLPPSKSEYEQNDAEEHDLEAQMRAAQAANQDDTKNGSNVVEPGDELDVDTDASLEEDIDGDDLGQEEEPAPKKKGVGKGTIIAAVGATVIVALSGVAYFMQGQIQKPAPISKKIAIDPSLLEVKPVATPLVNPSMPATPVVLPTPAPSMEVMPNLNVPTVTSPSGGSALTAPPSDPFASATTSPGSTALAATPVVVAVPLPMSAPVVTPSKSVSISPAPNVDGPRADPFGSVVVEKPIKAEKVVKSEKAVKVETTPKSVVEPIVKNEKAKPVAVVVEDVEVVKPRVIKKSNVSKPRVIRQDMTISEPHPAQERMQPQSNESFQGYEKLF